MLMKSQIQVLGTVQRLTRVQAVLSIVSVDGTPLASGQDWQGIIRRSDVRASNTDSLKMWDCFRPGDVVRASVVSSSCCPTALQEKC